MEITPKMQILIEDADKWLGIKCPGYGWKNWITKGIEANEFPWSCSMVYEDAGHDAIRHIVILCGFGDRLKEFTFTKPGEQPGGKEEDDDDEPMTEEELKEYEAWKEKTKDLPPDPRGTAEKFKSILENMKNQDRNLTQELTVEKLKQHAIEFAGWLIMHGYSHYGENQYIRAIQYHHGPTSAGYGTVVESADVLYQQFLDSNLSDVEKFRVKLISRIAIDYAEKVEVNVDLIIDKIRNFQLP